jgi:proline iminopeptidase
MFSKRRSRHQGFIASILCAGAVGAALAASPARPDANRLDKRDGFVDGCGAIIYYEAVGQGPPLIVLHGGPGSSHGYFLPDLLPLARHHQLVFIDERGSGQSQRLADVKQYNLAAMACDVDALRRALHLGGATDVLGHSFGGILAQAYAVKYPANIRRLVLAGTGSSAARLNADFKDIKDGLDHELRAKIDALEAKGIIGPDGAQLQEYRKLADEAELPYNYAVRPPAWSEAGDPIGWDVLTEMWGSRSDFHIDGNLVGFDFVPELRKLSIPTLIIAGDHDLPSKTTLEETHAALRNSELVILKHSGHMIFTDQNDAFIAAVSKFLED